jgi:hypothetical protein
MTSKMTNLLHPQHRKAQTMSEPTVQETVEVEEVKPAKKTAKAKPVAPQSQTERARAIALAKIAAAKR